MRKGSQINTALRRAHTPDKAERTTRMRWKKKWEVVVGLIANRAIKKMAQQPQA